MPVAKSFQKLEMVSEPYEVNGKMYIQVRFKNQNVRQVRWYTEKEYEKLYPAKDAPVNTPQFQPQKDALGFQKGYITIFKGEITEEVNDFFKKSNARYATSWGWYIVSTEEVPELPWGIDPVKLRWDSVGNEAGYLIPNDKITKVIDNLLYDGGISKYQAQIGDRIERTLTVVKNYQFDNYAYGKNSSTMHTFEDAEGNIYLWTTSAKNWNTGTVHHVRGTVKDHNLYKGNQQTVLTRVMEVKK